VLDFHGRPVTFGEVRSARGEELNNGTIKRYFEQRRPGDQSVGDIRERLEGKRTGFNASIIRDNEVCLTVTASGDMLRDCDGTRLSKSDYIVCSTFPQDYDFGAWQTSKVKYACGMSVPPNMMANIAAEVRRQWLDLRT
jgi:DNA (cytosine-5)-methyltransferase 1